MSNKIQIRRDTFLAWEQTNPILSQGEIGCIINTQLFKIGDGINVWNNLKFNGKLDSIIITDDCILTSIDLLRSSIEVNVETQKTIWLPEIIELYNNFSIPIIIVGNGDVIISTSGTDTIINETYTSIKGTQKYSNIELNPLYSIKTWIVKNSTGNWGNI